MVTPAWAAGPDGAGGAPGHVEPDRLARRGERGVGQGHAEGLGDDLRGRGGAEELAAAAGAGAGAAAQFGGLLERDLAVGEAGADGLDLAGVLALLGRQRDAAGDEDAGQVASSRPGPSSWRAGPCRRWRRRARPSRRGQRADQPAEDDGGVVAVGQAVHHARSCPGSGRRRGRRPMPAKGTTPEPCSSSRRPRRRAGRPPSGRCGSRARSGSPVGARRPPWVLRIRNGSAVDLACRSQPMPAFWVRPNRSPEGQERSISSVSGRVPEGPSEAVRTS